MWREKNQLWPNAQKPPDERTNPGTVFVGLSCSIAKSVDCILFIKFLELAGIKGVHSGIYIYIYIGRVHIRILFFFCLLLLFLDKEQS